MQAQQAATTVDGVLHELRTQQENIDRRLANGQRAVDTFKKLQAQVKADIGAIERAATDLGKARTNAQKASDEAQRAWDAVHDQLDELEDHVKADIDSKIATADKAIGDKQSDISGLRKDLDALKDEQAQAERALAGLETNFRDAVGALQQLPARLGQAVSELQKLQADLKTAADAGQARKAYVLAKELARVKGQVDSWRAPAYEQQLAGQYEDARHALDHQRDQARDKQQQADAKQAELAKAEEALTNLKAARAALIKELFVAPPEQPDAKAAGA